MLQHEAHPAPSAPPGAEPPHRRRAPPGRHPDRRRRPWRSHGAAGRPGSARSASAAPTPTSSSEQAPATPPVAPRPQPSARSTCSPLSAKSLTRCRRSPGATPPTSTPHPDLAWPTWPSAPTPAAPTSPTASPSSPPTWPTAAHSSCGAFAAGDGAAVVERTQRDRRAPEVAFLFTGQGSHYAGMGRAALRAGSPPSAPRSTAAMRCSPVEIDRPLAGDPVRRRDLLDDMRYAQPALFAFQYALAELWRAWGVRPDRRRRPQRGRVRRRRSSPACARLEDGLRLIAARGRLMDSPAARRARWPPIFAEEAGGRARRGRAPDRVGIAAVNGPTTTVISGRARGGTRCCEELDLDRRRLPPPRHLGRRPLAARRAHPRRLRGGRCAPWRCRRRDVRLISSMTGAAVTHELTDPATGGRTCASRCASPTCSPPCGPRLLAPSSRSAPTPRCSG